MKKIDRRQFVKDSVKITSAIATGMAVLSNSEISEAREAVFVFSQMPLPYAYKDLEPHIDAMTMEIHYSKHHAAYVKNVNDAIAAEHPCGGRRDQKGVEDRPRFTRTGAEGERGGAKGAFGGRRGHDGCRAPPWADRRWS